MILKATEVTLEDSSRAEISFDAALASVQRQGVLTPALGYRDTGGSVIIRDGHHRVLAARQVGKLVPVALFNRRGASVSTRIIEQLVLAGPAVELSDLLAAYRRLHDERLTAATTTIELALDLQHVERTAQVAFSPAAAELVA